MPNRWRKRQQIYGFGYGLPMPHGDDVSTSDREARNGLERLIDEAVALIQKGDCLEFFGTTRASLSRAAGLAPNTWDYWFDTSGKRKLRFGEQIARRMVHILVKH